MREQEQEQMREEDRVAQAIAVTAAVLLGRSVERMTETEKREQEREAFIAGAKWVMAGAVRHPSDTSCHMPYRTVEAEAAIRYPTADVQLDVTAYLDYLHGEVSQLFSVAAPLWVPPYSPAKFAERMHARRGVA
jgi:hypothetical protein